MTLHNKAYWGKSSFAIEDDRSYHLLSYHCLDVAAVGQCYLQQHKTLTPRLAQGLGLPEHSFIAWQTFFLALHDVGKFSKHFQGMLQKWPDAERYSQRHDSVGWLLWEQVLAPEAIAHFGVGSPSNRPTQRVFNLWAQTVTGHHGQPPKSFWDDKPLPALADQFSPQDTEAARDFMTACAALFLPNEAPTNIDVKALGKRLKPLSWWLAGIAVLSDWLGSNRDLFEYRMDDMPLSEYWHEHALPQAEKALENSGVLPLKPQAHSLKTLFDYLTPPTPLQLEAATLALAHTPQLFILEDVTGSGKTEAALMLAHRLIHAGHADDVYMGLPSMATSNAMFKRIQEHKIHHKFWSEDAALLLAHSASKMQQNTPRHQLLPDAPAETDYQDTEDSAATQRGAWLYDHRKKCLLADFGVGTLDQVLLATLYSRHQSLRLLGLSRKVLIVDEVHACDVYMQRLLEGVLEFQATIGAPVILLSATLPRSTRQCLVDAYCKGLSAPALELTNTAYPLLTQVSAGQLQETPLKTRPEVARRVAVSLTSEPERIPQQLLALHQQGQCACWIRNTVQDALDAVQLLREAGIPTTHLDLFHARFALGDRLEIERRVLARFDKDSRHEDRRGQILVATQVVEQSLDLDFDFLVSDLAPIDLLIQRAGRLRRHVRDAQGHPAKTEQRGTPEFWVYSPSLHDEPDEDWYKNVFPRAAYVYEHHGQLWLTAKVLDTAKAIVMPEAARDLIESVYGDEALDQIPEALQEKTYEEEGKRLTRRMVASTNLVKLNNGYTAPDGINFWDDTRTPTRLGDESVTVRLARWENGVLKPWFKADCFAWELSQVNVSRRLINSELNSVKVHKEQQPDKGRWSQLVILQTEGEHGYGEALNSNGDIVRVIYDATVGLRAYTKMGNRSENSLF